MTSNQRRPGFRLPWSADDENPADADGAKSAATPDAAASPSTDAAADSAAADAVDTTAAAGAAAPESSAAPEPAGPKAESAAASAPGKLSATAAPPAEADKKPATAPAPAAADTDTDTDADAATDPETTVPSTAKEPSVAPSSASPATPADSSAGFMRDLVAAMRRVAEETRQTGLSDLRTRAEEHVRTLEADAERRRDELQARADRDVAGIGEWEKAEAERIKREAEQRVVARRAELDQQLAAETTRAETEAQALRDRVSAYEKELDSYHAQLSDIADPAAFAVAAKKMPAPPRLDGAPAGETPTAAPAAPPAPELAAGAAADMSADEALAARLAELGAVGTVDAAPDAAASSDEPTATEVRVTGLGSFGAITGFRQALAAADGIETVSLSLGPTGEFVFRAAHAAGFNVASAIAAIEGDAANIEVQPDGALRVTLTRSR